MMKRYLYVLMAAAALAFVSCADVLDISGPVEDEEKVERDTRGVETRTLTGIIPVSGKPLTAIAEGGLAPLTIPGAVETAVLGAVYAGGDFPDLFVQSVSGTSPDSLYYCKFNTLLADGRPQYDAPLAVAGSPWSRGDVNVRIVEAGGVVYGARMDRNGIYFSKYDASARTFSGRFDKVAALDLPHNPVGFTLENGRLIVLTDDGSVYVPDMPDRNNSLYNGAGKYFGELSDSKIYRMSFNVESFEAGAAELVSGDAFLMLNGGAIASFSSGKTEGFLLAGRLGAVNFVPEGGFTTSVPCWSVDGEAVCNPCWLNSIVPVTKDGSSTGFITSGDGALHYFKLEDSLTPAGAPVFAEPVQLMMKNGELFGGTACVPTVVDWDGDNVLDIVCGNSEGRFLFFKNYGTDEAPAFGEAVVLKANGLDACVRAGYYSLGGPFDSAWGFTSPVVFDWNDDGTPDILFSSNATRLELYLGNGKQGADCLKTRKVITYDGLDLWGTWQNRPAVARIGGKVYVAVMDEGNAVHLYKKQTLTTVSEVGRLKLSYGSDITGHRSTSLMPTLTEIGRTKLDFCDWDGDGDMDLLAGTTAVGAFPDETGIPYSVGEPNMQMMIFENIGDEEEMVFKKPRLFTAFGGNFHMGKHAVAPVMCWLGDTKRGPNMLVGTESGKFYFFERHDLREKE